jgi:hypothetical protein
MQLRVACCIASLPLPKILIQWLLALANDFISPAFI